MKKLVLMLLAVLVTFTLVGCLNKEKRLNANDLTDEQLMNPQQEGNVFVGWFTDKDCKKPADVVGLTPTERRKLYLKFIPEDQAKSRVSFNTKGGQQLLLKYSNQESFEIKEEPKPTKKDFEFRGWYKTAVGQTWNDSQKVVFPYTVTGVNELHAHFVPKDQKNYKWSDDVTLRTAFIEMSNDPILNPFVYTYDHENDLMSLLKTDLYRETIDWKTAVKQGLAAYPGDYSKLSKENVGQLRRTQALIGALSFPKIIESTDEASKGQDGTVGGVYDETLANNNRGTKFEIQLRRDMKWEDGKPVTAQDFVYTFLQFVDPLQLNNRAPVIVGSADRTKGYNILNARYYYNQGRKIGFDAKPGTPEYNSYLPDFATAYFRLALGAGNTLNYPEGAAVIDKKLITKEVESTFTAKGLAFESQTQKLTLEQFKLIYPGKEEAWYTDRFNRWDPHFTGHKNTYYIGEYGTLFPEIKPDKVGIKVKDANDPYTLVIEYQVPTAISSVLAQMNMTLVHKDLYEKSLNKQHKSDYGTNKDKIMSYGPFFLKEWSSKAKWVFNRNFDSPASLYTNYKSICYEVYSDRNSAMTAFQQEKIHSMGVTYDYKDSYPATNPNVKEILTNYPSVFLLNPTKWDGQQKGVDTLIKDINFRKALFYGFDRNAYTNSKGGYGNKPSLMFSAIHSTQFDDDPQPFFNDGKTQELLKKLGINLETVGFDGTKAKEYFDKAYNAWKAISDGETVIKLSFLHRDSQLDRDRATFIEEHFEKIFGKDKLDIIKNEKTTDQSSELTSKRQFDIQLSAVGTAGAPTNLSTEDPLKVFFMTEFFGNKFGNSSLAEYGIDSSVFNIKEEDKIDLTATYNKVKQFINDGSIDIETVDNGTLKPFYEILHENNGYFFGDLMIIFNFMAECTSIWAGNHQGFEGETNDRNAVTRAFYKIALEQLPIIPVCTTAGYVVRNEHFKTKFPAFHPAFKWGPSIAQYLATDSDFANF